MNSLKSLTLALTILAGGMTACKQKTSQEIGDAIVFDSLNVELQEAMANSFAPETISGYVNGNGDTVPPYMYPGDPTQEYSKEEYDRSFARDVKKESLKSGGKELKQ